MLADGRNDARPLRVAVAVVGVVAVAIGFRALDRGALAAPPLAPSGWADWLSERGPIDAAMSLVRIAAEVGAWYLVIATGVQVLLAARAAGPRSPAHNDVVTRAVARCTAPGARLVLATVGMTWLVPLSDEPTAGRAVAPDSAVVMRVEQAPSAPPIMRRLENGSDEADQGDAAPASRSGTASEPATAAAVPRPPATAAAIPQVPAPSAETMPDERRTPRAPAPAPDTWEVGVDESFWTIAEEVVGQRTGSDRSGPDVDAVGRYWRRLVDANRARLVDPADPDLLFVGQVLDLPPHAG